jgi:hypothetical protein
VSFGLKISFGRLCKAGRPIQADPEKTDLPDISYRKGTGYYRELKHFFFTKQHWLAMNKQGTVDLSFYQIKILKSGGYDLGQVFIQGSGLCIGHVEQTLCFEYGLAVGYLKPGPQRRLSKEGKRLAKYMKDREHQK